MCQLEDQRDPLEEVAADFIERRRRGEDVTIEECAGAHAELAEEIRQLFPTISILEDLSAGPDSSECATAEPFEAASQVGDLRIVRRIGRGGMGIVYEAEQQSLGRRVAVKVLPKRTFFGTKALERFRREARTAGGLSHPNIMPVHSVGEEQGYHYIVMQLIDGVGLDQPGAWLNNDGGAVPTLSDYRSLAAMMADVAGGLSHAHQRGILHRDLKPANLMLDVHHKIWITDFGLAKGMEQESLSQTGDFVGTLRYMAPEQFSGTVDQRSEVYSLGLTIYELVTNQPAFSADSPSHLIGKITRERPAAPRSIDANIPADLEAIITRAIAREPGDRYATAGELAVELRSFSVGDAIAARPYVRLAHLRTWVSENRIVIGLAALVILMATAMALPMMRPMPPRRVPHGPPDGRQRPQGERPFGPPEMRPGPVGIPPAPLPVRPGFGRGP